ncbi:unnamed protein product [Polarella glacialis]|uniref:Apple domain-containing protein n=1 Tax=Polarella glacialis TaxID=89957 RepID=A0A813L3G4_POLGL|nr:unnamed protein product [Polarella glacialis]
MARVWRKRVATCLLFLSPGPSLLHAQSPSTSSTTTTTTLPTKEACRSSQETALTTALVQYRFGGWQYAVYTSETLWPGGAVGCRDACEADTECHHWMFDCKNLQCSLIGDGGYEEDPDGQFGRDYVFLGDSTRLGAATTTTTTTTTTIAPVGAGRRLKQEEEEKPEVEVAESSQSPATDL